VRAVRDAVGADVDILIETHDRLTVPEAIRIAKDLEEIGVTWMEAPVWAYDVAALIKVAESTTLRIVAGERFTTLRAFADLLACGRVDVIQPEYIELGGVSRLVQAAAVAEAYQATIAPHNARSPLSTAVNVHVDAAVRNVFIQETFNDFHVDWARDIFEGLPTVVDGHFSASDEPGLGVTVNEEAMKKHPYDEANFMRMFTPGWEQRFSEEATT
jgi:galactonate dehydratase